MFDVFVEIEDPEALELRQRHSPEPEGDKRVHIHAREAGRFNQRYSLLFRDYQRSSKTARAYGVLKKRLSEIFPESVDG